MAANDGPRRIAILGGGVSGLAAAMRLTEDPEWKTKYEVTLYQMGWRLGGKCASGRSGPGNRIEEHGIHIWLGFYENAFRMIQQAYAGELFVDAADVPDPHLGPGLQAAQLHLPDGEYRGPVEDVADRVPGQHGCSGQRRRCADDAGVHRDDGAVAGGNIRPVEGGWACANADRAQIARDFPGCGGRLLPRHRARGGVGRSEHRRARAGAAARDDRGGAQGGRPDALRLRGARPAPAFHELAVVEGGTYAGGGR